MPFEERRVEVKPGYRLNVFDSGNPGHPVLLIHGRTSEWRTWLRQVPRLRREGYRVYAVDLNGHGKSDFEPKKHLSEHAIDLHNLVLKLGVNEPLVVVGHSDGGSLAQQFAAQYPEDVRGLALISGFAKHPLPLVLLSTPPGRALLRLAELTPASRLAFKRAVEAFFRYWVFSSPAAAVKALRVGRLPHPQAFANHVKVFERFDSKDIAPRVRAPTLVIHSRGDRVIGSDYSKQLARLYNARYVEIPGATHAPHWENNEAVSGALLDFLAEAAPAVARTKLHRYLRGRGGW